MHLLLSYSDPQPPNLGGSNLPMYFMSLNHDGRLAVLTRAEVFTGTTADADGLIDRGHHGRIAVFRVKGYHLNSSSGTVAGAVATGHIIIDSHTVLLDPYGMTNLDGRLLNGRDGFDGSRRTNLRTARTLWTAVAALIRHDRLHERHQVR